ncbi:MlaA family lipoprotein [Lichenicoccus roseus]|uniref:VacJ family lipoprotein n=1 Tax=Lichenicoccus roseus TaxID=2683649 RepID=A0A5R9JDE9_9PROT|nr:VacJ family lipoprotein [Lichenicoccus roseus]TLU72318.1 VacJ family lipoprotein [Lichenicoccus roseus]
MRTVKNLLAHTRCAAPVIAAALLLGAGGCAQKPTDPDALADYNSTNDPLEPTNRFFFRVNNTVDKYTLKPVAQGYVYVVPQPVRTGVHNALANFASPATFFNDIFETKPRRAGDTLVRFVVNSTAGIGGVLDVAKGLGYPAHDADGGMTLASWGVPQGPYLYLPGLGPSSPQAATGFGMDIALSPLTYVPRGYGLLTLNWALYGIGVVDARAGVLDALDQINRDALDPYATLRSLYRQHRAAQIEAMRKDNRMTTPDWYTQ